MKIRRQMKTNRGDMMDRRRDKEEESKDKKREKEKKRQKRALVTSEMFPGG